MVYEPIPIKFKNTFELVVRIVIMFICAFGLTGCFQSINNAHSQWRGEDENKDRLAKMYVDSLPLCDGREISQHKLCVAKIRKEFSERFSDRYRAYYTALSAESLFATAIVLDYVVSELKESKGANSDASPTNSKVTSDAPQPASTSRPRLCRMTNLGSQYSVSLSSFTIIPVTCF